jgi:toxin ParE1/3/4
MSAPDYTITLTAEAQDDYADILTYTEQEWGEEQRDRYDATLLRAFTTLTDNPRIGRPRADVRPGCRAYLIGRHLIFYELRDPVIL